MRNAIVVSLLVVCVIGISVVWARVAQSHRDRALTQQRLALITQELAHARALTDSVAALADSLRHDVRRQAQRVAQQTAHLQAELHKSRVVLRDSAATVEMLRARLDATVTRAAYAVTAMDSLQVSVRQLEKRLDVEREAWHIERVRAREALATSEALRTALERASQCRVWKLPCPSRTTLGLLLVAVAVL
jgi:chromosome segregation ATPase